MTDRHNMDIEEEDVGEQDSKLLLWFSRRT